MKRQGGFTLIEMIVVIVILGILAVTAAPKFISFQDEAEDAALRGLKGAIDGAYSIVYAKAALEGKLSGSGLVESVATLNGYPDGTEDGIGASVVGIDSADWEAKWGTASTVAQFTHAGGVFAATEKCVVYAPATAAGSAPVVTIANCTPSA
ncbi:type II secretion system protein [Enterovibrio baiacu]|uniref:type II secretion system protein n=1 Tax=Enterovibrio baiacu TaxID=2491023 RepID=UPI0010126453|nr:type II secretion system protein [Enterovibrio baiacu]MBE1276280.1 type II secretion system protein [Enterovibrio baiacu]